MIAGTVFASDGEKFVGVSQSHEDSLIVIITQFEQHSVSPNTGTIKTAAHAATTWDKGMEVSSIIIRQVIRL